MMNYRVEHDLLGEMQVPAEVYWGIHTQRAVNNFTISVYRVQPVMIKAVALVKKACCETNRTLGYLDNTIAEAIIRAADEIAQGMFHDQFPVDAMQGGAGTSTNMNVNEVCANRALELLGYPKGDYAHCHPIEHVNMHQSTNDVYPTALRIACIEKVRKLSEAIALLQGTFQKKEKEFADIITIGRTELQDAVPITLGGQFSSFAEAISRDRWRTFKCEERLRVVNIGGTAVGTGLTAPRKYIFLVNETIRTITGYGLTRGENLLDQTANADVFVEVSGICDALSSNLIKICNDLRLLHMLGEVKMAPVQAGSSIMPGKVNPVILESVISACLKTAANHTIVANAVSRGSLQINEFLPLIGYALLESMEFLANASRMLSVHIDQCSAVAKKCSQNINSGTVYATALLPHIGYEKAQQLVKEYQLSGLGDFRQFLIQALGKEIVESVLTPQALMSLGYRVSVKKDSKE
jgi:aspartate ammonia-lyase